MKGLNAVIAIILILIIVIALAALAYTWFSGVFRYMSNDLPYNLTVVGLVHPADLLMFMDRNGCDSLVKWWDGTLKCSKEVCLNDATGSSTGYCKYVYVDVKE